MALAGNLARSGFRVQGSGCRVQGAGFRVQGSGFRIFTVLIVAREVRGELHARGAVDVRGHVLNARILDLGLRVDG